MYAMIRILCVVALLVTVGAHNDHDSWKFSMKRFFDTLNHDINIALRKSAEPLSDSTYASSTTAAPTSGCASTQSSSTTAGCQPKRVTTESSTHQYAPHVGSIRGIPGVNFPDYTDIPLTSFSCSDKDYIPGFYADMETGCQVFHVCWPHRRESFLCPLGTIFNQALLACDYWYSSNCSLAPVYYNVNTKSVKLDSKKHMGSMVNVILGAGQLEHPEQSKDYLTVSSVNPDALLSFISQFLPVKAKITVYPETVDSRSKIVATASVGKVKQRHVHHGKSSLDKPSAKKSHTTSSTASDSQTSPQSPETAKFPSTYAITSAPESQSSSHSPQTTQFHSTYATTPAPESQSSTHTPKNTQFYSSSTATSTSESQYSTQSYETSTPDIEIVVDRILNKVSEVVQNIIRDASRLLAVKESKAPTSKYLPLTELNPRFIVKPVVLPEDLRESASPKPGDAKFLSSIEYPAGATSKKTLKGKVPRPIKLSVSPMTKAALTTNYLRLLKIRKA